MRRRVLRSRTMHVDAFPPISSHVLRRALPGGAADAHAIRGTTRKPKTTIKTT